jgi:hypothetical protein
MFVNAGTYKCTPETQSIFGKNNKMDLELLQKHMNKSKYCKKLY